MGSNKKPFSYALLLSAFLSSPAICQEPTRLTPFMKVEKINGGIRIPANTYTRLEITADPAAADAQIGYEKRALIWRIGIGKKYTFNSLLKVDVGDFKDSIPLLSREYESSTKAGESFSRTVSYDGLGFPYFLAGSDGQARVARFAATADMAETNGSQVASLGLAALRAALKGVAPGSSVVTTLTRDTSRTIADRIDSEADKMFATTVGEELKFDVSLSGTDSYRITLYGPERELDVLMKKPDSKKVLGIWRVRFAEAKPSVFSVVPCADDQCDGRNAYIEATSNPATVLSFKLLDQIGDLGTVKSYLRKQDWWSEDMQVLEVATDTSDAGFGRFCRKIRDAISELGLNDLDGRIVAASVARSGLVSETIKAGMEGQEDCAFQTPQA